MANSKKPIGDDFIILLVSCIVMFLAFILPFILHSTSVLLK